MMGLSEIRLRNAQHFHDETLPKDAHKTAHFCSMRISQDLREEAKALEAGEAEKGIAEKSAEFLEKGGKLYV